MSIEITSMKLFPSSFPNSPQKGYGSIILNGLLEIRVVICANKSTGELYLSFPQKATKKDDKTEYSYLCNWATDSTWEQRNIISEKVCKEFKKILALKEGRAYSAEKEEEKKSTELSQPVRAGFFQIPIPTEPEPEEASQEFDEKYQSDLIEENPIQEPLEKPVKLGVKWAKTKKP